ncbi:MAG: hypothetical protein QOJ65_1977 [Fimbriimonadaceae bacterium]|jgi:glucose/arabinose dehydrogenase|nr:hypothetical protein [Fimbriimonadaceae bacterium]
MRKLALGLLFVAVGAVASAQLPAGFTDTAYVSGFTQPTAFAFGPNGKMFVTQKRGPISVVQGGSIVSTFTTIDCTYNSERGVLGIALDPDFDNFPYVYVYYTTNAASLNPPATPKNRVSRFTANGNVVVPGSETILLDLIPSDAGNHNAGCIRFGLDGKLYIATGDGGSNHANSQDLSNLAGKILRINKDGSIPSSNPYFGSLSARNEIFCYGLRNPFRFSIRPGTNTLYIGDVGESTWEEVDIGAAGGNFGWNTYEGPTNVSGFITPQFYYMHTPTLSASITGGCFVTGKRFPPLYNGSYFYGDYIRGIIRRVTFTAGNAYIADFDFTTAGSPVDFGEGPDGALYYSSIGTGAIRRIVYKTTLSGLTLNPTSVPGGIRSRATITLDNPAPAAGALINLTSTTGATVPATIKIPGGGTSVTFNVETATRTTSSSATITATRLGVTKQATLTLTPTVDAHFVSQNVPTTMIVGHQYTVSVTMHNAGYTTWTHAGGYRLLAFNPSGTNRWGIDRMFIPSNVSVAPDDMFTFNGTVTAPSTPGTYNFQWRMLLNSVGTFGMPSDNVVVTVN